MAPLAAIPARKGNKNDQGILFFEGKDACGNVISFKEIAHPGSKDLEKMLKIIAYHNNEEKKEKRKRETDSYSANPDKFACVVYDAKNNPIAYWLATKHEALPINKEGMNILQKDENIIQQDKNGECILHNCAHICKLGVLEKNRGKGIASLLDKKATEIITERWSTSGVWLECKEKNKKVYSEKMKKTIYEHRGYMRACTYKDEEGILHFIDYKRA